MKKIIVIILFVLTGIFAFSQTDIAFDYDANGNRILRYIDIKNKSLEITDTTNYNEDTPKEKLSINDKLGNIQIRLFPNPVKQWLNIEVSLPAGEVGGAENWEIDEYSLFNNGGKLIDKGRLSSDNRLDFKNYSPGLYLLEIKVDGEKQVWKILKD